MIGYWKPFLRKNAKSHVIDAKNEFPCSRHKLLAPATFRAGFLMKKAGPVGA